MCCRQLDWARGSGRWWLGYGYPKGFLSLSEIVLHCTRKSGLGLPWVWNWTPRKSAWEAAAVLATLWRRIDGVMPIGHGLLIWISSPCRNDCSRDSGGTSRAGATTMTMRAVVPSIGARGTVLAGEPAGGAKMHRERVPRLVEGTKSTFLSRFLQGQQSPCGSQSETA